jgi:hypothetical protein
MTAEHTGIRPKPYWIVTPGSGATDRQTGTDVARLWSLVCRGFSSSWAEVIPDCFCHFHPEFGGIANLSPDNLYEEIADLRFIRVIHRPFTDRLSVRFR